jgi:aspartate/methionine/tyrosine aminotransferase
MTGWKIGYVVGPAALHAPLRAVHQFVTFATATPFQDAMATAMEQSRTNGYYVQLQRDYTDRRDALRAVLADIGWEPFPVRGSYFLSVDVASLPFADDVASCRWLTAEVGVAAIPTSAFYHAPSRAPNHARFCFAKRLETIAEAERRLAKVPDALRRMELADVRHETLKEGELEQHRRGAGGNPLPTDR